MLALHGVLLALLSRSAQLGVECFQPPPAPLPPYPHPSPAAAAAAAAAAVSLPTNGHSAASSSDGPSAVALSAMPSVDSSKVSRIAERMCGLKGAKLSIGHMCASAAAEGGRSVEGPLKALHAACSCAARVGSFSGACAMVWLLRSGLADRPSSAAFLCRRLIAERAIRPLDSLTTPATAAPAALQPASAGNSTLASAPSCFYSSPSMWYMFGSEYCHYQQPTEADIVRLALDTTNHADTIAALCKHYNHKEDRRRQSDKLSQQLAPTAAAAAAAADGSKSPAASLALPLPQPLPAAAHSADSFVSGQTTSHRLCSVRVGVFLGSELVRWLKRTRAARSTRDAVLWGNYLIQHRIIAACQPPYPDSGLYSMDRSNSHSPSELGSFRYAAIWYELQPSEQHISPTRDRHLSAAADAVAGGLPAHNTHQSGIEPPPTARLPQPRQLSHSAAVVPSPTADSESIHSSSPLHSSIALVLPLVDSSQAAEMAVGPVGTEVRDTALGTASDVDGALPLSVVCGALAGTCDGAAVSSFPSRTGPSLAGSSVLVPLLSGWEFVQSFGDEDSSYDFADADDLVTAVEFHPSGEYLAIGDKAGRVSIVEEATLRADGSGEGRLRATHHAADEQAADEADGAGLRNPLEFR